MAIARLLPRRVVVLLGTLMLISSAGHAFFQTSMTDDEAERPAARVQDENSVFRAKSAAPLEDISVCAVDVRKYNLRSTGPQLASESVLWSNCLNQLASRKGEYGCGDELIFLVKFDRKYGNPESSQYDAVFHLWANSVTPNDGVGFEYVVSAGPNSGDSAHTAGSDLVVLHDVDGPFAGKQEIMSTFRFAVLDIPQGTTAVIRIKLKLTCRPYAQTYQNQQSVKLVSLVGTMDAASVDFGVTGKTDGVEDYFPQIRSGTVPYFVRDVLGALTPWLSIENLGVRSDKSCEAAQPLVAIEKGERIKHCISVENKGTQNAVDVVLEDYGFGDGTTPTLIPGLPDVIPAGATVATAYISEIDDAGADKILVEVRSTSDPTVSASSSLLVSVSEVTSAAVADAATPTSVPNGVLVQMNLTLSDCADESPSPAVLIGFVGDSVTSCVRITNDSPDPFTVTAASNAPHDMLGILLQPGDSYFGQESTLIEETSSGSIEFDVVVETDTGLVGETHATLLIGTNSAEPEYCWGVLVDTGATCYREVSSLNEKGIEVTECQARPCNPSYRCVSLDPTTVPVPATSSTPTSAPTPANPGTTTGTTDVAPTPGLTLSPSAPTATNSPVPATSATYPPPADTGSAPSGETAPPGPIVYETLAPTASTPLPSYGAAAPTGTSTSTTSGPGSSSGTPTETGAPRGSEEITSGSVPGTSSGSTTTTQSTVLLEKRATTSLDSNCELKTGSGYVLVTAE